MRPVAMWPKVMTFRPSFRHFKDALHTMQRYTKCFPNSSVRITFLVKKKIKFYACKNVLCLAFFVSSNKQVRTNYLLLLLAKSTEGYHFKSLQLSVMRRHKTGSSFVLGAGIAQ